MIPEEGLLVHAVKEDGRHLLWGLVEDGEGQRIPEEPSGGLALAGDPEILPVNES